MARIRSIKPEFFTSEVIASLPISARLTFIGLWTYVDDNGVGLDNERLIVAAIWPLEEDAIEALRMTREDLRRIAGEGLVTRYGDGRRRFLHITSWEEHQRISHPSKPRYPLPGDSSTCINGHSGNPPEGFANNSGTAPETLRRTRARAEQGAGSKEQGAGNTTAREINSNVEGSHSAAGWTDMNWLADASRSMRDA